MSSPPSVLDISDEDFRLRVYDVISRELGLTGYARFLRTFCSGPGDYTADRHQWLGHLTVEEIARDRGVKLPKKSISSSTTPPR